MKNIVEPKVLLRSSQTKKLSQLWLKPEVVSIQRQVMVKDPSHLQPKPSPFKQFKLYSITVTPNIIGSFLIDFLGAHFDFTNDAGQSIADLLPEEEFKTLNIDIR